MNDAPVASPCNNVCRIYVASGWCPGLWRTIDDIAIDVPAQFPFGPLALLRLAWACALAGSTPYRRACEHLFHHVRQGGANADAAQRLQVLRDTHAPERDAAGGEREQPLEDATTRAAARGIFGVPTVEVDGPAWDAAAAPPPGVQRR